MITDYSGYSTTACWTLNEAFINRIDCVMMTMGEYWKGTHTPDKLQGDPKTKIHLFVKMGCSNVRTMFYVEKSLL